MANPITTEILDESILQYARKDITLLEKNQTIGETLQSLRRQDLSEKIVYFYVVDEAGTLAGVVPVRRLVMNDPAVLVSSIMVSPVISIPSTATALEACEMFMEHRLLALPITDPDGKPIGLVDVNLFTDEVTELAYRHQVSNAFQIIGVHAALGRKVPAWMSFKDRFPWLLCNIASGILCALIASRYELLIQEVTILALFLTVVLALGESVSMQSMTITLQGFAQTRILWSRVWGSLQKEFFTASMLGGACGFLVGGLAWIWRGETMAAAAIGGGIFLSIMTACLLGVIVPTLIRYFNADPKIAAGPIVLASADVATLLYYFNLTLFLTR